MWSRLAVAAAVIIGLGIGFGGGLFLFEEKPDRKMTSSAAQAARLYSYPFANARPDGVVLIGGGWDGRGSDCVWSNGRGELHIMNATRLSAAAFELLVEAEGLVTSARPSQSVNMIVNGSLVTTLKFAHPKKRDTILVEVSGGVLAARSPLAIAFIEAAPAIPSQVGGGDATAPRSICLKELAINTKAK